MLLAHIIGNTAGFYSVQEASMVPYMPFAILTTVKRLLLISDEVAKLPIDGIKKN